MWKKLMKARRNARAEVKAAQSRAKAEVKARAQLTKSQTKLLAKQEAKLRKAEAKGLKAKQKLAETKLKQIQAGRVNRASVARVLGAARLAAPVLVPLVYQAITKLRSVSTSAQAKQLGVAPERLGQHSGYGAPIQARIDGISEQLAGSGLPSGFVRDMRERLEKLSHAVDNAEFLTPEKRRGAHRSINQDVDAVVAEIDRRHR
ncbi:hypothetical protein C1Y63_11315 [Corynebacterium sp. 13CS0277]|uniref:DUF6474 family protein n=1 Tax=Corynebacterium sp. 13CS0277 TaxID=2071994 RepID=UPI000D0388F3|nr:DUF6474 family protein [Corynebacterium sp. 13CS0277]PRQ10470.1 hypothetical protein C1Y63_11315 [Corynebacterium sp. 13CS0277]